MQVKEIIQKLLIGKKVYIILFQIRVNRHVCDVINFMINREFRLSTDGVIMNIAVSFSLRFAENMLNMS